MTYLLDVNVWMALAVVGHVGEIHALQWYSGIHEADELLFCRVTQQAFLRLLTNQRVMGKDVRTPSKAWKEYDQWKRATDANFAPEPPDLEDKWRSLTPHDSGGPNQWTDAYLAAFASTGNFTLVTFDNAFLKFNGVRVQVLRN